MSDPHIRLGCQTNAWPVDPAKPQTLFASLRAIRELGFIGFETSFRNIMPLANEEPVFRGEQHGLTFFGAHIFLHEYDKETRLPSLALALEAASIAANLGCERLILSGAPAPFEAVQRKAAALNDIAARIEDFGVKLLYHNHAPELQGPNCELESLLARTDHQLVSLLLDAGHAFGGGIDLIPFLKCHSERVTAIHLRDFDHGRQVPLGAGDFPLQEVANVLKDANWSGWVLAEEEREDGSKPALAAVKPARQALRRAFEA